MEKELKSFRKIEMPEEMKKRIIEKCNIETEVITMKKINRKPMLLAASLAIIICLGAVTAFASSGRMQGFFSDVLRWDNAVVGTEYEDATDEISVTATAKDGKILVEAVFLETDNAPYLYIDLLGINACTLTDINGNVIETESVDKVEIIDGRAVIEIAGNAEKIVITEFVGGAKAEQDLVIAGVWECVVN